MNMGSRPWMRERVRRRNGRKRVWETTDNRDRQQNRRPRGTVCAKRYYAREAEKRRARRNGKVGTTLRR